MSRRATSSVIGIVLLIGIVVVTGGVLGVYALGVGDNLNDPAPNVAESSGEFEPGNQTDEQLVQITHVAGDNVAVEKIEIIVRASGPDVDEAVRLVDLPPEGTTTLEDENIVENDDLIDQSVSASVIGDAEVWAPGDTIDFRINTGEADFREGESPDADKLEVIIVHTPSDAILYEETFTD